MYRVKHNLSILASLDTTERLIEFERTNSLVTEVIRTTDEVGLNQTLYIAKNTVQQAIDFGAVVTGKLFYLETDQELAIFLNGAATGIVITPAAGAKAKFFIEGTITSVELTNASTTDDALVSYLIAGTKS